MAKKCVMAGPSGQRAGRGSECPELLSSHCMLLLAGKRKSQYSLNFCSIQPHRMDFH